MASAAGLSAGFGADLPASSLASFGGSAGGPHRPPRNFAHDGRNLRCRVHGHHDVFAGYARHAHEQVHQPGRNGHRAPLIGVTMPARARCLAPFFRPAQRRFPVTATSESPFSHKNFLCLWSSSLCAYGAMWIQAATLSWLAYDITGSSAMVGAILAVRVIPLLSLAPLSGVAATAMIAVGCCSRPSGFRPDRCSCSACC